MLYSFRAVVFFTYLDKLCYLTDTNLTQTTEERENKEEDKQMFPLLTSMGISHYFYTHILPYAH
jgi:isocitrate dehydrogenase kinase/phosphatase